MVVGSTAGAQAMPVVRKDRIDSLDILRGVAVFGIFLMNISGFGLIWQAYYNPFAAGGTDPLNLGLFATMNIGFEGTMRGIFSLLFGAGIVLMTGRMEESGAGLTTAEIHFRRMSWLLLFGFIHWALLLWSGEILFNYALCGFVLFTVRKWGAKWQLAAGLVLLLVAAGYQNVRISAANDMASEAAAAQSVVAAGRAATQEQLAAIEAWDEARSTIEPTEETTAKYNKWHQGSYVAAVTGQYAESYEGQWQNVPRYLMLDIIPFMLIGMALLKMGVLSAARSPRFYASMLAVGYAVGLSLGAYEYGLMDTGDFSRLAVLEAGRTYQISRLAMVFGHLGLLLLVIRLSLFRRVQRWFAAAGQMALSNYIAQSIICMFLFYGFGFGLFGKLDRSQLYAIVLIVMVVELVCSVAWLKRYRYGPLEWVWRSLTYWRPQPMRLGGGTQMPIGAVPEAA